MMFPIIGQIKKIQLGLPLGLEFTIFEDGNILPLATPKSSTIENYIALTNHT